MFRICHLLYFRLIVCVPCFVRYAVEDTGPVCQVTWTPDNRAFAVGWRNRGLAVWSASGCRLMCTIRQGSMSNSQSPSPRVNNDRSTSEPMVEGVAALAWGEHGYELFSAERGNTSRFFEFHFAKRCLFLVSTHRIEYLFMYMFIHIDFVCINCTFVEEFHGDCWWFWIL